MDETFDLRSAEDMVRLGARLAPHLEPGDIVYLHGVMGSGKTTLVRGIAAALGCARISSPTFTLMNIYPTTPVLYHMDFYRLTSGDVDDLGLEDYAGGIMLIEWPEVSAGLAPEATWTIHLELTAGDYDLPRRVRVQTVKRSAELQEDLRDFSH
jgi:tRNA threonylcarbamoyladenosine biosynthesis protein TsaE